MFITNELNPAPMNGGFKMEGYWVWCGSVIKGEDGRYHMFASRWPKTYTMHPGWIYKSEIVRASSDLAEGPYHFEEVVLPERGADFWDGRATHNPFITKHDDTYILFYTGTTYPFESVPTNDTLKENEGYILCQSNKRIGIATSTSVFGPWKRQTEPILPVRPGEFDSFLTSNAAPSVNEDGSVILVYKARQYVDNKMGPMTLGAAYAPHYLGPYDTRSSRPLLSIQDHGEIEDPYIWRTKQGYSMIAKDMEGSICGEKYGGVYAESSDGFNWTLKNGYKAYSRDVFWESGEKQKMGSFERPFILFEDGKPTHLFAATSDGPGGFVSARNTWNMVIPII